MGEELVWTRSEDGLQLEGIAFSAAAPPADMGAVLVHGAGSRFYSRSVALLGRALASRGIAAVSGNNRGHDYGAFLSRPDGSLLLGGLGWEDLRECSRDVAAWADYARRHLGVSRLLLVGQSLGGFKVAACQAERADPHVAALALLSPVFGPPPWARPETVELARSWVAGGRGDELLPEVVGWMGRVSARCVAGRDPQAWAGGLPALVRRAAVPTFVSYGTRGDIGGPAELEVLRALGAEVRLFEGADHAYTGRWDEAAGVIADFAARV